MPGYPRLEAGITFSQSTELDYSAARIHALQRSIALAQRSDASTTLSCRSSCIALAFFAIESASVQIANHASALTTSTLALLARCKNSASPALRAMSITSSAVDVLVRDRNCISSRLTDRANSIPGDGQHQPLRVMAAYSCPVFAASGSESILQSLAEVATLGNASEIGGPVCASGAGRPLRRLHSGGARRSAVSSGGSCAGSRSTSNTRACMSDCIHSWEGISCPTAAAAQSPCADGRRGRRYVSQSNFERNR